MTLQSANTVFHVLNKLSFSSLRLAVYASKAEVTLWSLCPL